MCLITWLLLRTYQKDAKNPTLPTESVQYGENDDFAPIEPQRELSIDTNNEPVNLEKKNHFLEFFSTIRNWLKIQITKISLLFSKIKKRQDDCTNKRSFKNKNWKKITKIVLLSLLIISLVVGIILSTIRIFNYYKYSYLPEKKRQDAIAQILNEIQYSDEETKRIRYIQILQNEPEWDVIGLDNGSYPSEFLPLVDQAFKWFEDKAYAGDSLYQLTLATLYDNKINEFRVEKNLQKAAYWYQQAAENGFAYACSEIAMCYANGDGVETDFNKAIFWFRRGVELNDPFSAYHLGNLYLNGVKQISGYHYETYRQYDFPDGRNTPEIIRDGKYSFPAPHEKIARRWDENRLEWYNIYRKEVPIYKTIIEKDINKAKELWRKAAAQGHQPSKDNLERIYNEL